MFENNVPLKLRPDGTFTFFPNGTFSKKGYILTHREADWVRNFITAYYSISMSIVIIGIFVLHKYLITILLGSIISLIYYMKIQKFLKDKPQTKERLKPFEDIKNMSKKTFILMILGMLGSVFFIVLGLIIILRIDKKISWEGMGFLLFSIILFALFSSLVILKLKRP